MLCKTGCSCYIVSMFTDIIIVKHLQHKVYLSFLVTLPSSLISPSLTHTHTNTTVPSSEIYISLRECRLHCNDLLQVSLPDAFSPVSEKELRNPAYLGTEIAIMSSALMGSWNSIGYFVLKILSQEFISNILRLKKLQSFWEKVKVGVKFSRV